MAQALSLSGDCQILSTRPRLTFRNGSYYYQITRQGNRNIYTVTNGANSISEPLLYWFGLGRVGQTYLFKHNGLLYETRLSYYQQLQGLGFTTGHPRTEPTSLEEALGRPLGTEEVGTCFGCYSTAAIDGSQLQLERVIPGVACEGCHGPGQKHIAAVKDNRVKDLQIIDPGTLDADTLSQEFCGSCHRSFDDVMLLPRRGASTTFASNLIEFLIVPDTKAIVGSVAWHVTIRMISWSIRQLSMTRNAWCATSPGRAKLRRVIERRRLARLAESNVRPATCLRLKCLRCTASSPIIGSASPNLASLHPTKLDQEHKPLTARQSNDDPRDDTKSQ